MPRTVDIDLKHPFAGHGGMVNKVTLREPTGRDFVELGEPSVLTRTANGTLVSVENDAAVRGYIERCVVEPDVLLTLAATSLVDMIAIKRAVLNFFLDARLALSADSASSSSSI